MSRTMLCENSLPRYFWVKGINTACHILNRVSIRPILKKTPYELYKDRKPNISYFRALGYKCFVLNNGKEPLRKFHPKSDECVFLGYSNSSKAYRIYNKRTMVVEEFVHAKCNEKTEVIPTITPCLTERATITGFFFLPYICSTHAVSQRTIFTCSQKCQNPNLAYLTNKFNRLKPSKTYHDIAKLTRLDMIDYHNCSYILSSQNN